MSNHGGNRTIKALLIYYSQSGEAQRVAELLTESLRSPDVDLTIEVLQPRIPYPFPWKSIGKFFDVLPECHWGPLPELAPLQVDLHQKFDLVILVYQVWFLAPSLPIQSFLKSKEAAVLRDAKVFTVSVSRNMWQSASETMKQVLRDCGARHMDNVVLTHYGPAWATLISTPRALLFGKREAFWKIFPPAGIDSKELDRLRRFSETIIRQREKLFQPENSPLLCNQQAVKVDMRYLLAERMAWHCFRWWGLLILALGRHGKFLRRVGIYLFVIFLVSGVLIVLPLTILIRLLFWPVLRPWMTLYAGRLQEPSGR